MSVNIICLFLFLSHSKAADIIIVQSSDISPYREVSEAMMQVFSTRLKSFGVKVAVKADYKKIVLTDSLDDNGWRQLIEEENPVVLLPVGTRALKVCSGLEKIPIVYSMVPAVQPLIKNRENITGIAMTVSPGTYLRKLHRNFPYIKRIGVPFNPQKKESVDFYNSAKAAADLLRYELIGLPVTSPKALIRNLGDMEMDALWMWPEPSLVTRQSIAAFLNYSLQNNILLMTFARKYLKQGAGFAVVVENQEIGKNAALQAVDILDGNEKRIADTGERAPMLAKVYTNSLVVNNLAHYSSTFSSGKNL